MSDKAGNDGLLARPIHDPLEGLGVPVSRLATDSRHVKPGDVFVAMPGARTDGRDFIEQAIASGAAAVIWDARDFHWDAAWHVPNLAVAGLQQKLGFIAASVYGDPSRRMRVTGVTGTNGKTSCSHWIAQSLTR